MKPAPGSLMWLVANDMRNNIRMLGDVLSNWPVAARLALALALVILLHAAAYGAFRLAEIAGSLTASGATASIFATGAGLWMVSQGLLGAARALYQRGELELLLSSPMPPWKPVAARAISIAGSSAGSLAAFLIPTANVGAYLNGPHWLAIYPLAAAWALAGTACGFVIAVALFHAVGPRLARMVAQVTAALIAGLFVLAVQILAVLPDDLAVMAGRAFDWINALLPNARFAPLASAVSGDPLPALASVPIAAALFVAALVMTAPSFVRAASVAAGTAIGPVAARGRPFREGPLTALRLKETRLLLRDPNLFAQLGLQIVYTLPLSVILLKNPSNIPPGLALLPLVVVLASQVSASLSWLTISGEDAPELIATAPLSPAYPEAAKLTAVAIPLAAILLLPTAVLYWVAPGALIYAVVFGALAALSTALLNFWHPMPGNRRGMLRRHHQSKIVALAEHGLTLLWALATVCAVINLYAALVPIALVVLLLWCFKPRRSARRPAGRRNGLNTDAVSPLQLPPVAP